VTAGHARELGKTEDGEPGGGRAGGLPAGGENGRIDGEVAAAL
jgi:hypothetical protein